jgi:hypothetical protein
MNKPGNTLLSIGEAAAALGVAVAAGALDTHAA